MDPSDTAPVPSPNEDKPMNDDQFAAAIREEYDAMLSCGAAAVRAYNGTIDHAINIGGYFNAKKKEAKHGEWERERTDFLRKYGLPIKDRMVQNCMRLHAHPEEVAGLRGNGVNTIKGLLNGLAKPRDAEAPKTQPVAFLPDETPPTPQKPTSIRCHACMHQYELIESDGSCPHCFAPFEPQNTGNTSGDVVRDSGGGPDGKGSAAPSPGPFSPYYRDTTRYHHEPTSQETQAEPHHQAAPAVVETRANGSVSTGATGVSGVHQPKVGGTPTRTRTKDPEVSGPPRKTEYDQALEDLNATIDLLSLLLTTTSNKQYIVALRKVFDVFTEYAPGTFSVEIPEWLDREMWEHWMVLRNKKRKGLTAMGARLQIERLQAFRDAGHDANEILKTTIRESWQSTYEPEQEQKNGKDQSGKVQSVHAARANYSADDAIEQTRRAQEYLDSGADLGGFGSLLPPHGA